jgi:hypothetical protein
LRRGIVLQDTAADRNSQCHKYYKQGTQQGLGAFVAWQDTCSCLQHTRSACYTCCWKHTEGNCSKRMVQWGSGRARLPHGDTTCYARPTSSSQPTEALDGCPASVGGLPSCKLVQLSMLSHLLLLILPSSASASAAGPTS